MKYIQNIVESSKYLLNTDEPVRTLFIGGILWYYGTFTLIPLIFVWGYLIRVLRDTTNDMTTSAFNHWKTLFTDGLGAFVIWGVFFLIPVINQILTKQGTERGTIMASFLVLLAGGGILAILIPFGGEALGTVNEDINMTDFSELWDVYLLLLLVWYVTPAALVYYASTGSIRDGFDFDALRIILTDYRYATGWFFFILMWAIGYIILPDISTNAADRLFMASETRTLSGLGNEMAEFIVLSARLVSFYLLVTAFAMIGRTCAEILSSVVVEESSTKSEGYSG